MNIVQFLPYFPPHKGGLETHAQEWGQEWSKKSYGNVVNVFSSVGQENILDGTEKLDYIYDNNGKIVGYNTEDSTNLVFPAFDIISGFPFPKFWKKEYKYIKNYIKNFNPDILITRTRFFWTSFVGGLFAKKNNIKRVHIEHGSQYVQLSSNLKTFVAYIYDKTIGKWIFKNSDETIGVSKAAKNFVENEFGIKNINFIYRGLSFIEKDLLDSDYSLKHQFPDKILVGFLGRLYKWKNVEGLINAYYQLSEELKNKIQIVVVGEGEDIDRLKNIDKENKIYFSGGKHFEEAINLQKQFDIHFHTSCPGGGLATTILQAMYLGCFIVATPYEGADEVIDSNNGILLKDCSIEELKRGLIEGLSSLDKKEEFANINQKIIKEKFSWDKNIKQYYLQFEKVLKN